MLNQNWKRMIKNSLSLNCQFLQRSICVHKFQTSQREAFMVNVVLALWQVRVNHCSLTRLTDKSGGGEAVVQSSQARWTLERTAKLWWAGISHLCVLPLNTVSLYGYIHLLHLNCSWTIFIYLQFRFSFHLLPGWWSEPLKFTYVM